MTSARLQTRFRNRPVGEQRFPPDAFQPADVGVEPEQERDADHDEGNEQRVVDAGLQDAEHDEEHPDRGQDGAHQVEADGSDRRVADRSGCG